MGSGRSPFLREESAPIPLRKKAVSDASGTVRRVRLRSPHGRARKLRNQTASPIVCVLIYPYAVPRRPWLGEPSFGLLSPHQLPFHSRRTSPVNGISRVQIRG